MHEQTAVGLRAVLRWSWETEPGALCKEYKTV